MPTASNFPMRAQRTRWWRDFACTLVLAGLGGRMLLAEPPPVHASGSGSVGQYLADHESDLDPFFTQNAAALINDAFRHLFSLAGETVVILLALGWVIDLMLSRGFSILIAPAYANTNRALIYASGRLLLNVILTAVLALDLTSCLTLMGPGMTTLLVFALVSLSAVVVQVVWFSKVYRSNLVNAVAFYLGLLVVHAVVIGLAMPVFFSAPIDRSITAYMNACVAPRLQREADSVRDAAAGSSGPRDTIKKEVAELEARISAARTEEQTLQKAIEDRKNSADYAFSKLVKVRAGGDLSGAREKFVAFLQQFPNGPTAPAARGQLGQIDQALAAEAALKKQQEDEAAQAAAEARAHLLAQAAAGQATLSEMRLALIGKTPAEVSGLFGAPAETASDRWGYAQKMTLNPSDQAHHGLTVIFADGVVQGVDYYYGGEQ